MAFSDFKSFGFDELTPPQLYQMMQLRVAVFVVEQDCPYQDIDGLDQTAQHVMRFDGDQLIAYARILPPTESQPHLSIGRVVVAKSHRDQNLGKGLMQFSIQAAQAWHPGTTIKISAQRYLTQFYQELGFQLKDEYYLEDDIPHQGMILKP